MAKHEPINRNYEAGIWNKEEGPTPEQKKGGARKHKRMIRNRSIIKGGKRTSRKPKRNNKRSRKRKLRLTRK